MNPRVQSLADLDRVIHEPGRLILVALLSGIERADFLYLQRETGMNKGTLSSHLSRLEEAAYVEIEKSFRGKIPQTLVRLTPRGRKAFEHYRRGIQSALR